MAKKQKTNPKSYLKFKSRCELARRNLYDYCLTKNEKFYKDKAYLKEICDAIQEFENDDNELLVINAPPRFGKSFTATNSAQWLLGRNPKYKMMTCSYNETLSMKFSRQVRNAIQESFIDSSFNKIVFKDVFPSVKIKYGCSSTQMWALDGNNEENYLATSPNATTTGIGADFIIIDDIIKNKYEACNSTILSKHWEWFTDTLYSRLEGKRKILVFMTRWATKDLAGRLIQMFKEQKRKYRLITKKACDNGVMLNDTILNYQQYQNLVQTIGEEIVRANYDQEPIDLKGILYENLITYDIDSMNEDEKPKFVKILANCDTADTGLDYLCCVIYGQTKEKKNYILDVYYTQDSMEITEEEVAKRLTTFKVQHFYPESNNGGRGFSRSVERRCREMGNNFTVFRPYTQTLNKQARILSNATTVELNVFFPKNWSKLFPTFYQHVTEYQRTGKNEHDDAPDCLTSIVEKLQHGGGIKFA